MANRSSKDKTLEHIKGKYVILSALIPAVIGAMANLYLTPDKGNEVKVNADTITNSQVVGTQHIETQNNIINNMPVVTGRETTTVVTNQDYEIEVPIKIVTDSVEIHRTHTLITDTYERPQGRYIKKGDTLIRIPKETDSATVKL